MYKKKKFKVPLDKFINYALYHPKRGYYMHKNPFGKDGDFITAPYISIIFSEMICLWLISFWEKFYMGKEINIVELGAGNGELMYQIINSAEKFNVFFNKCNFKIFEKSRKLIELQKKKLKKNKIVWLKNLNELNNKPTIFIGNEFLDALPIKQYIKSDSKWYERYVENVSGSYKFTNIKCDIKKIEKKLNFKISKNQKFLEISFEAVKLLKNLNGIISKKGGCILMIDYAYLNNKMFDTLQAVKKHKKVNVLKEVGSADITHIINIPILKKITKSFNLEFDYNTQRDFLLKLGIMKRAEILAANKKSFLEKANIFYRINRLIGKNQMGELFKVIYFYKKRKKFKLGFE